MLKDITIKLLNELPENATEEEIKAIARDIINIQKEYEGQNKHV